jgi:1-hydroxy-2-naphthoate dioxygenase
MAKNEMDRKTKTLPEFDVDLAKLHLRGQWTYDEALSRVTGGPIPSGSPYLWKWNEIYPKLLEACEVMPESLTARRNFSFINPASKMSGTTHSLLMGVQITKPGEVAWAHRHSMGAIRFVIDGDPLLYTAVDGEKLPMESRDLVLTPANTWHDHHNESLKNGIWLDILDAPLVFGLHQASHEPFGESTQPLRERQSDYVSERGGSVRPAWETAPKADMPFRYSWRNVNETLRKLSDAEGSPYDGVILQYANPIHDGATLPTIGCFIQMLRPRLETKKHRQTSSAVYFVVEGEGTTIVGDTELNWATNDAFVVPNWMWHRHINNSKTDDAILFSATDMPVLMALGLYHEEPTLSIKTSPLPAVPGNLARQKGQLG